jgi:hypothetical protein
MRITLCVLPLLLRRREEVPTSVGRCDNYTSRSRRAFATASVFEWTCSFW